MFSVHFFQKYSFIFPHIFMLVCKACSCCNMKHYCLVLTQASGSQTFSQGDFLIYLFYFSFYLTTNMIIQKYPASMDSLVNIIVSNYVPFYLYWEPCGCISSARRALTAVISIRISLCTFNLL